LASADHDQQKWSQPNVRYGEAVGLTAQNEIGRKASPATLRRSEKSACPVSLSGVVAAPMIDLVARICESNAIGWD
jgi:hypothetical protein